MSFSFIEKLKAFCKRYATVGIPVKTLHEQFIGDPKNPELNLTQFVLGLQSLNKRVIIDLKDRCIQYARKNGNDSYITFITTQEFVPQQFWNLTVKKAKSDPPSVSPSPFLSIYERYLPSGYREMHWVKRKPFIEKQTDLGFLRFLLSIEKSNPPKITIRKKIASIIGEDLTSTSDDKAGTTSNDLGGLQSDAIFEVVKESLTFPHKGTLPEDTFNNDIKNSENLTSAYEVIKNTSPIEKKKRVRNSIEESHNKSTNIVIKVPKSHKECLPIDWDSMHFSQRLEFARNIANKEFKAYVEALEPKIKQYLDAHSNQPQKKTLKLSVTLFEIPSKKVSQESKALLKEVISNINGLGRGRLEYVESIEPPRIEIREVR